MPGAVAIRYDTRAAWTIFVLNYYCNQQTIITNQVLIRLAIRQYAAWAPTLTNQNIPERRNPQIQRKPMHKAYLPSMSTTLPFMLYLQTITRYYTNYRIASCCTLNRYRDHLSCAYRYNKYRGYQTECFALGLASCFLFEVRTYDITYQVPGTRYNISTAVLGIVLPY